MFWNIFINQNKMILKRRLFLVEALLLALLVLGILLAIFMAVEDNQSSTGMLADERIMLLETLTWPEAWNNVIRLGGWDGLAPFFLIILIGATTAQEYNWRTLQIWLSRGISRPELMLAKLASLLFAGLLLMLTVLVIGGLTTAVFSTVINGSLNLSQIDLSLLVLSVMRAVYTMMPYACLTFFLAVASRSTVVAISGGLAYALLLENLIMSGAGLFGREFSRIALYLPGGLANSLMALNKASLGMGSINGMTLLPPIHAAIGIAAWILFFLGLSLWIFQHQDLAD